MNWGTFMIVALASIAVASACPDITSTTTPAFFNELSNIDSQLDTCPVQLPGALGWLLGDGETVFNVQMNDGSLRTGTFDIQNSQITGIRDGSGICTFQLTVGEDSLDTVLQSQSRGNAALFMFANREVRLNGCTFWTRFKSAITKPVARWGASSASTTPQTRLTGKPANCDETYMQGHRGYSQNQALWDGYSSNTDSVCQSQYGTGTPNGCVHTVQLSVSGNPYYLCWYNN